MIDSKILKGIGFHIDFEGVEVTTWRFMDIEVNISLDESVEIQIDNVTVLGVVDEDEMIKFIELVYNN